MTKYTIVGNRSGWTYEEVKSKLDKHNIEFNDIILSGGANGVDTYAQQYAKEIGCKIVIDYPHMFISSPIRYFQRNRRIVMDGDELIAFNKKKGRSGTLNSINWARNYNKKITIYDEEP